MGDDFEAKDKSFAQKLNRFTHATKSEMQQLVEGVGSDQKRLLMPIIPL